MLKVMDETENKHCLCNWCKYQPACNILKMYQVVCYDRICLEYEPAGRLMTSPFNAVEV